MEDLQSEQLPGFDEGYKAVDRLVKAMEEVWEQGYDAGLQAGVAVAKRVYKETAQLLCDRLERVAAETTGTTLTHAKSSSSGARRRTVAGKLTTSTPLTKLARLSICSGSGDRSPRRPTGPRFQRRGPCLVTVTDRTK